jgi:5-methylcytosine-specific restriction endonuclease McrA
MRNRVRQLAWDVTNGRCFYCLIQLRKDSEPFPETSERPSSSELKALKALKAEQKRIMEIDHRIPLARGGSDTAENRVPACNPCNAQKQKRTDEEYRWYLLTYGIEPHFHGTNYPRRNWISVARPPKYSGIPDAQRRFANHGRPNTI